MSIIDKLRALFPGFDAIEVTQNMATNDVTAVVHSGKDIATSTEVFRIEFGAGGGPFVAHIVKARKCTPATSPAFWGLNDAAKWLLSECGMEGNGDGMNIIDELRREFPGWTIGLRAGGKTAKCWKHGDEPPASQVDDYALVSEADGVFLGTPLGDSEAQTFPTLLEAAEYALGEKAEGTKARVGDPVLAELQREFPAFTVRSEKWDGRLLQYIMWHASEPKPVAYERTSVVANDGPDGWTAMRPASAPKHGFTTPIAAAECATGTVRASYTKGAVIDAEVTPEYDNGDPETEADKASFAEFARLAPFRKTWPEWAWSSPDADTYIGEVDGETWTCKREPGGDFRGTSPFCQSVCYSSDAYQAMRSMMAWPGAEQSAPRKDFTAKPRLTLIPAGVLARHLLPVLHDGAKKHGRDHWRKCSAREYAEAAASHLLAFLDGQDIDESGHHSLAHAMADCALALGTLDKDTTP